MNINLSNQERKLIFDAYSNCGVHHPADRAPFRYMGVKMLKEDMNPMRPVLYGDWSGGTNPELACESPTEWKHIILILSSPLSISDEDAIVVARILAGEYFSSATPVIERNDKLVRVWTGGYGTCEIHANGTLLWKDDGMHTCGSLSIIRACDYLREKKYDMGYGPVSSLINAGIAIDKSKMSR